MRLNINIEMNEHLGLVFKTTFKEPSRPKIIIEEPVHLGLVLKKTIKEEPVIPSSVEPVRLVLVFKTVEPVQPVEPVEPVQPQMIFKKKKFKNLFPIPETTLKMKHPKQLLGSIALLLAAGYLVSN